MSMYGSAAPSLADIAAVTRNGSGNGGFGDGNGWWVLIILFALFGGWGNNGYGNNGGGGQGTYDTGASMQRGFDTSTIIAKLDGINSGICSLGYDQLAQMNGIQSTIMQTGYGIQNTINQQGIARMQDTFGLTRQIADCCCENRAQVADLKYTMATDACALNTNIHQTGDAIINSQQQGFNMLNQTINDRFTELQMQQKDTRIAELEQKLQACDLDRALQGQASYILSRTNPEPRPAYLVQNPNCCNGPLPVTIQQQTCGCNQGCNQGWN